MKTVEFKNEKALNRKMREKQKFAKRQESRHNSPKYRAYVIQELRVAELIKNLNLEVK